MVDLGALLADNWTKITYDGHSIGYSHTQMASHDEGTEDVSRIQNRTVLQLNVLGRPQRVTTSVTVGLDEAQRLQHFEFDLHSRQYTAKIQGKRTEGNTFTLEISSKHSRSTTEMEIPDDVVIYSPLTEMALSKLKPGQTFRIKTLDPVSMQIADVMCRAIGKETIEHRGAEVPAMRLEVTYQGMTVKSWMDDTGRVIRQETPLGWVMEASDREEAMALDSNPGEMKDMILATAVPLKGGIINPRKAKSLRLRLTGLHLDPEDLKSYRQEIVPLEGPTAEVTLQSVPLPSSGLPISDLGEGMEEFLESTAYVQADDPKIIKHANKIIDGTDNSLVAAQRIYTWVEKNIEKNPAISLPSALDVLIEREGDCNEHTYLYVALARAVGLPAQIRIGLVYNDGAFYYHAWPSVYVGEWVEMDPTLSQPTVDATHLALLEGELAKQIGLTVVMGQLKAEVLDEVY